MFRLVTDVDRTKIADKKKIKEEKLNGRKED
jgi:hypothetical protein